MTSPSDNDKNKDAASDAKASSGENKADKFASAKETLNKVIYKTGVLAGKAFAVAKAVTKDVVQELRNVNSIRKETVATAAEGTKKTDLAKTFWTKTSQKQKLILLGMAAVFLCIPYSFLTNNEHQSPSATTVTPAPSVTSVPPTRSSEIKEMKPPTQYCSKATDISKGFGQYVGSRMKVSVSSVRLISSYADSYGGCAITVDTAKGPQSCVGASVYSDGVDYWIGGSCF
jgi:hypothetical protein